MRAYNFSKFKTREKRLYSIDDLTISSTGLSLKFLGICAALVGVSVLVNVIIYFIFGFVPLSPFQGEELEFTGTLVSLGIPIGIGCLLWYTKIQQYRLIDFLIIYLTPKPRIDLNGNAVKEVTYKFDAFLER